jgi:hypothetical protein
MTLQDMPKKRAARDVSSLKAGAISLAVPAFAVGTDV